MQAIWEWVVLTPLAVLVAPALGGLVALGVLRYVAWARSRRELRELDAQTAGALRAVPDAFGGTSVVLRGRLVAPGASLAGLDDGSRAAATSAETAGVLGVVLSAHAAPGLAIDVGSTRLSIAGPVRIGWGAHETRALPVARLTRRQRARLAAVSPQAEVEAGPAEVILRSLPAGVEVIASGTLSELEGAAARVASDGGYRATARPLALAGAGGDPVLLVPARRRPRRLDPRVVAAGVIAAMVLGGYAPSLAVRTSPPDWPEPPRVPPFRPELRDVVALLGPARDRALRAQRELAERGVADARGARTIALLGEALHGCDEAVAVLAARGLETEALRAVERCPNVRGMPAHVEALVRLGRMDDAIAGASANVFRAVLEGDMRERSTVREDSWNRYAIDPPSPLRRLLLEDVTPCGRACRARWRAVHRGEGVLSPDDAWAGLAHRVVTVDPEGFERDAAPAAAVAPEVARILRVALAVLASPIEEAERALEDAPTDDDGRLLREIFLLRRDGNADGVRRHLRPPRDTGREGVRWFEGDGADSELPALARFEAATDHRGRRAALADWSSLEGALVVAASVTAERRELAEAIRHRRRAPFDFDEGRPLIVPTYATLSVERGVAVLLRDEAWTAELDERLRRFEEILDRP